MDIVVQRHGQPSRGQTQLHIEASYGDVAAVERLLAAGVAVDAVDNEGFGLGTVEIAQQITKLSAVVVLRLGFCVLLKFDHVQ